MDGVKYSAPLDPYCYPGTGILVNIPGFQDRVSLEQFELERTSVRADEALPHGRLDVPHFKAVHRHLFQDVYRWSGEFRTVSLSKNTSRFCEPQFIPQEMDKLFGRLGGQRHLKDLDPSSFAREAADFLADLNAIHAFREGNGRTQLSFMGLLANEAGHTLRFLRADKDEFLEAMIESFGGNKRPLQVQLMKLIE